MKYPRTADDLAVLLAQTGTKIIFFTADWCGDCQFIYPSMPEIEGLYPNYDFIRVDRDAFMDLAQEWGIFGIPSFIVWRDGKELARLVNKQRKTKVEIITFLNKIEE